MVGAVMSVDIEKVRTWLEESQATHYPRDGDQVSLAATDMVESALSELEAARARIVEMKAQHVAFVNDLREAIK